MTQMESTKITEQWQAALLDKPDFLKAAIQHFLQKALEEEFQKFIGLRACVTKQNNYQPGCEWVKCPRVSNLELTLGWLETLRLVPSTNHTPDFGYNVETGPASFFIDKNYFVIYHMNSVRYIYEKGHCRRFRSP